MRPPPPQDKDSRDVRNAVPGPGAYPLPDAKYGAGGGRVQCGVGITFSFRKNTLESIPGTENSVQVMSSVMSGYEACIRL